MYLKSIDIQGFKSFANKMKFEFHNGITSIVGPNGSGKSNVADAVRWVLGEQKTKQLRSSKMEDVIFSGTENRKPLGFAYVAITLDNSDHALPVDFEEVVVSRRLFRSGESEYMINGSACRLKDINELFYDTGIGKEGYSIIGQGQIDKILSGKPEERRELFDEAAGIVKFKRRKKEALKKLEDENQNLMRVEDILSELEKQVGPLAKQSEEAKEYLRLRDELKIIDINTFLLQTTQIKNQLVDIDSKISIATEDLEKTNQEFNDIKNEYEQLDSFIEELNQNVEDKKNILNESNLYVQRLDAQIQVLNEQINSVKVNDEFLNDRVESIANNISNYIKEKEDFLDKKKNIEEEITINAQKLSDVDSKQASYSGMLEEKNEQIESYKADIIELMNSQSNLKAKLERYDAMIEQISLRHNEINAKIDEYNLVNDEQDNIIKDLQQELERLNVEIEKSKQQDQEFTTKIQQIRQDNKMVNKDIQQNQVEYHRESSKLESLKNLTERYEGYGNSVKKLMELKVSKKGIVGVVADIIKVDKKYETAIETALGGSIQNIVTDTESTAKELIEYLKTNKFGRATFLPLSSMNNRTGFNNEQALSEKGVIGLACDLVKIQKEYLGIAKYLLGRVVVVDTIDNAITLSRKYRYTLRIVTLEGEQLNPGGSMSGGAFRNASNLLGRRREIEDIKNKIVSITAINEKLTIALSNNKEQLSTLIEELNKIKEVIQQQYLLQNTINMNLSQASSKKEELVDNFESFKKENVQISTQLEDIGKNNSTLTNELTSMDAKKTELEQLVNTLVKEFAGDRQRESEGQKESEELRVLITGARSQHDFIVSNIKRIELEIKQSEEELISVRDNSSESEKAVESKAAAIRNIKKQKEIETQNLSDIEKEIQELNKDKESKTKEHKEFFNKREDISNRISHLDKEVYRLSSQKEKLEESKDNQINYIWNEYELTYSESLSLRDETMKNLSEMRKLVGTLKNQIKTLGNVNVNAIDDYKEVGERYEFMKNQYDDLMTAKENLMKIVDELDAGMKKRFREKFKEIQLEFDKVFKELFGGGKGEIQLEEDSDVLEAGIRIISQPPGKKLQNMMQMSGGEKALTAISLLFAIQNLKPSPFCLLDEIEAALDESNVIRFAEYLHKLKKNTQFIVITHRRGTMNSADRLYGITMQEKGISALVSVNLIEADLEEEEELG